ncbi:MAG TPA: DUF1553 domain-containing protein, partial [Bacteroidia bacterium]|nr:DUF1553 domain-containing protein [Bacteroidia bacterium]
PAGRRSRLIAQLLGSEGHVSHAYHFWADILRVNSRLGIGATEAEAAYQLWIKDAIRGNKPYDQFVRELVTARGMIWENGAVGYYLRDRGMPLDNMSNTVRVFLGTRLECAQCHNHPFDKWTQMDYYQMAAFSYGMDARQYSTGGRKAFENMKRNERAAVVAKATGMKRFPQIVNQEGLERFVSNTERYETFLKRSGLDDKQFREIAEKSIKAYQAYDHRNDGLRQVVTDIFNPLRYVNATELEKTLKLPHDYQYDDAKPNDRVSARTMFGAEIDLGKIDDSAIEAYADWMVSRENPTFTRVIANRLWRNVFGHGVFEPVDELTDVTPVSNPELLAYLEETMKALGYDMRKYQEILYNTRTYQRAANAEELALGEHYYFAGPLLRRMSAEQIWDSVVALALPEADDYQPRLAQQLASVERVRRIHEALESRSDEEFAAMVQEVATAYESVQPEAAKLREQVAKAVESGDKARFDKLRSELGTLRRRSRNIVSEIAYRNVGRQVDGREMLAAMGLAEMDLADAGAAGMSMEDAPEGERAVLTRLPEPEIADPPAGLGRSQRQAWKKDQANARRSYTQLVAQMARASELESPAPRGHFLREFGQSDREVIENSAQTASVPQALNLLNGPIVEALTNPFATLGRRLDGAGDTDDKIRMIFQAMLTREPTPREMELARAEVAESGDETCSGLVWTLLNTQQFIFIQ